MQARLDRPAEGEYAPYYAKYVALVPPGDICQVLREQGQQLLDLLRHVPEHGADHAYAPGKWSIKEVLGHITDAERVFGYRALRFARADATPLAGFDETQWVPPARFGDRALAHLATEFAAVRAATIAMLDGWPEAAWTRAGTANDVPITVRALATIMAGHALHHQQILVERYFPGLGISVNA